MTSMVLDRLRGATGSVAIKRPCLAATTANITLSGEQTIDGVAVTAAVAPTPATRVLVKNQTTAAENGIYEVSTGAWSRAPDWDGVGDVVTGTSVRVVSGTVGIGRYAVSTSGTITVGTTSVTIALETLTDAGSFLTITVGTGTFAATSNYGADDDDALARILKGSQASPTTDIDAPFIIQKHSNISYPGPSIQNAALYVSHNKYASGNLAAVQGIFSEAQDLVGGAGSYFEGGRFHAIGFAANFSAYGQVAVAGGDTDVAADYLIAYEGWTQNNNNMTPPVPVAFDKDNFSASFLASVAGSNKVDAGFVTNPYNQQPARTGFLVAEDSVDHTAFGSRADTVVGLNLALGGSQTWAVVVNNFTPISSVNAAANNFLDMLFLDNADKLHVGGVGLAGYILGSGLSDYADDTAAAGGGIALNQLYRNGSIVMIRVA